MLTFGTDWFHENRPGSDNEATTTTLNARGQAVRTTFSPRAQTNPDSDQTNIGVFVHNDWDPLHWLTVSLGGRYDHFETTTQASPLPAPQLAAAFRDFSSSTANPLTGSAGVVVRLWPQLHLVGNISNTFRQPSTAELFGASRQGAGFLVPNPALRPERGVTYEGGARLRLGWLSAELTAFHSDYTDLIVRQPVTFLGTASQQRANVGSAEIDGVELATRASFTEAWTGFANATALRGEDTQANRPLPYIAPFQGSFGARYAPPGSGWYVEATSNWAAAKTQVDTTQERKTAGYIIGNLFAGFDLHGLLGAGLPDSRLVLGIENLFNTRYRNPTTVEDVRFAASPYNPLVERGTTATASLRIRF